MPGTRVRIPIWILPGQVRSLSSIFIVTVQLNVSSPVNLYFHKPPTTQAYLSSPVSHHIWQNQGVKGNCTHRSHGHMQGYRAIKCKHGMHQGHNFQWSRYYIWKHPHLHQLLWASQLRLYLMMDGPWWWLHNRHCLFTLTVSKLCKWYYHMTLSWLIKFFKIHEFLEGGVDFVKLISSDWSSQGHMTTH